MSPDAYRFGPFRLLPRQRRLLRDDSPVALGGRAFDLLEVLVLRRGRTVAKDELLDTVWAGRVVEENNLQVQVAALRRAIGGDAIATVPGRGYRFTLPVLAEGSPDDVAPAATATPAAEGPMDLIGRDDERARLNALLDSHALVTLAGPAGIGKTRLAQAVLHARPAGVWIDLSPCTDGTSLATALAQSLGVPAGPQALQSACAALTLEPRLLVLDNAEHLIDEVATLWAELQARAGATRVLVTSQAVLRLTDEQVLHLGPLALPVAPGLAEAAASGAVALFVARARAADRRFRLDETNVGAVVEVCRRLDGIPLALELGAARVRLLGAQGLRERLDDRFALLTGGARMRLPRHRTLQAAMEWSHTLLGESERRVFRRLAVFTGSFGLTAAQDVCADESLDRWVVLDLLGALVDRSLVVPDGAEPPRYRLLESARLFARQQLDKAGETADRQRRHARATVDLLRHALDEWRRLQEDGAMRALLRAELDNVRAACRWAEQDADLALGLEVAEAAGWTFGALSLHAEYLAIAGRWLARLPTDPEALAADPAAAALRLRVAATSKSGAHAVGLDAALAAAVHYRRAGDARRLHECLNCAVAIGARRGAPLPYEAMLAEARSLQRPEWPRAPFANHEWARDTWRMSEGRYAEALASHLAQIERNRSQARLGSWQASAANAAGCLVALGRHDEALTLTSEALAALDDGEAQVSVRGYVLAAMAHAQIHARQVDAALASAREALPLLEIEGDERLLLLPLALAAEAQGRTRDAARLAGLHEHDAAVTGVRPWPAERAAWQLLLVRLQAVLGDDELSRERLYGAGRPLRTQVGG